LLASQSAYEYILYPALFDLIPLKHKSSIDNSRASSLPNRCATSLSSNFSGKPEADEFYYGAAPTTKISASRAYQPLFRQ